MKFILRIFSFKVCLLLSVIALIFLVVLNFYGLYSNKFYFNKVDNYIFPVLAIVHLIYLYVLNSRIRRSASIDSTVLNLEYGLYPAFLIYMYRGAETLINLLSYSKFESTLQSEVFHFMVIVISLMYFFLALLSLITFRHRQQILGHYHFLILNKHQ
ncbi:hypothetical protein SAMN04487911_10998 [Arenibacter nanhaiticus]|uniref:Uncharacterized protein n=1 Tax=Arenibacter nanhaiticus TaxID=558155 RepID=A0A1M6FVE3_9FLAO|nr:hypothetical protein SAMN04487911_10998 [Arenibacter nanhaiticus]